MLASFGLRLEQKQISINHFTDGQRLMLKIKDKDVSLEIHGNRIIVQEI